MFFEQHQHPVRESWGKPVLAVLLALVLTGCASLTVQPESPNVSIANLELQEFTLFEQRYRLHLRIQNPNDFDLAMNGMSYKLKLNGRKFATGVSDQEVTVPAFGEEVITVNVVSNLARVIEQLREVGKGKDGTPSLRYELKGQIGLGSLGIRLPFSQEGDLEMPSRGQQHRI